MLCPVCQTTLQMTERQGVEIDYCSKCRGVWLDRGELDKIIEKAAAADQSAAPPMPAQPTQPQAPAPPQPHMPPPPPIYAQQPPPQQPQYGYHPDPDSDYNVGHGYGRRPYYKKRKSFLGELFDFD